MICDKLRDCVNGELRCQPLTNCCNDKRKCIESSDNRSLIKCEERSKKYILENTMKNHVISYKMDGGVISVDRSVPQGINKCDYLYIINGLEKTAILSELKGVNVQKSIIQIYDTLILFKDLFKEYVHVYGRAIVTSSTPNLKAGPEYVRLYKLIRQRYNGNIKIIERSFVEKDLDLDKE